jgi:glycosyltransferase 2 family protein
LGLLLPALMIVLIAAGAEEMPRVVSVWPLLAALGTSAVTWWLQALIYALLARPQPKSPRTSDMFRVEMAGLFVALVSPIRGAELPYKAYLLKRLGLLAAEGSNLVVTRVLLDAAVLTPTALVGLPLYFELPEAQGSNLLFVGLVVTATGAAVGFVMRARARGRAERRIVHLRGSGWRAKVGGKISGLLKDGYRSFASYWRPGHRATLVYAMALTAVYWAFRLSAGPLALMAVGWSGDWLPVVVAQLFLASFVLPFAPTPGGSGARELGLAVLLSAHVPDGQLANGIAVYTGLTYFLPVGVGALFAGRQLWSEIAARRRGSAESVASARRRTRAAL